MPTPTTSPKGTLTRRQFLRYSSVAASATVFGAPAILRGQNLNSKLDIAVIGAAGKGESDTKDAAMLGENIVALCDIDQQRLDRQAAKYPNAKLYRDYRKLLSEMGKSIDAVIVSTPDHHHAPAAALAMKMGKHAFVQKPLTQSVYEARTLRELAKKKKVATQMGNQGSAGNGLRRAVEVIQAGLIGPVRELHVWSNRPIWPQGIERPAGEDPVPAHIDWDLFLGPAPWRPYKHDVYHPFKWRGWKDFGTGALGDMACHTVNMPFRALKLGYPTAIECEEAAQLAPETYAKTSRIRFEFPEREGMVPLKFWWYDGNPGDNSVKPLRPPEDLTKEIVALRSRLPISGCLMIGDKGKIFSPDDYGSEFFLLLKDETKYAPGNQHEACKEIAQTVPRSPGHMKEFVEACKGGPAAYSNFDVAAYLTEIILLGCVAVNVGVGKKLDWDGPKMRAKNNREAAQYVRRAYRKGWKV